MATKMERLLDDLYKTDSVKYAEKLSTVKAFGAKVYRNSEGFHIIKYNVDDSLAEMEKIRREAERQKMSAFLNGLFRI